MKMLVLLAIVLGLAMATDPAAAQTQGAPDASGPQSVVPAPRPRGQADTPGGSARNGIIRPPPMGAATPVIPPPARGTMPVIRPPGAASGTQSR